MSLCFSTAQEAMSSSQSVGKGPHSLACRHRGGCSGSHRALHCSTGLVLAARTNAQCEHAAQEQELSMGVCQGLLLVLISDCCSQKPDLH